MPFSLRLRADPVLTSSTDPNAAPIVRGLQVGFTTLGAGVSNAKLDTSLPAKLEFLGRFTKTLRDQPTPQEVALGELTGQVAVSGDPLVVNFLCDADSLNKLAEEPQDADGDADAQSFSPTSLEISFASSFTGTDALGDDLARLFLPSSSWRFRYLEVCIKLTISGAVEADFDQNDALDVLIQLEPPPTYRFSV